MPSPMASGWRSNGFTLIEMMIALALLAILIVAAIPSFNQFRERAALRGAADQMVSFWGDARFEALRRNSQVKVGFIQDGGSFCIGAEAHDDATDLDACDCLTAGACDIAAFPTNQSEWSRVTSSTVTFGSSTGTDAVAIIDHKRGNLLTAGDAGSISFGRGDYRLNFVVDRNGRAYLCEPADAPAKLPQYSDRRCAAAVVVEE